MTGGGIVWLSLMSCSQGLAVVCDEGTPYIALTPSRRDGAVIGNHSRGHVDLKGNILLWRYAKETKGQT